MKASPKQNRRFENAKNALQQLEQQGFPAMLAGGCVRDHILGKVPKDYDIATVAKPEEVTTVFKNRGYKVIPTGIDHGTVTVVIQGEPVEITTLRKDVETDGRRAVVSFSDRFEDDALRRDFTINAMYMDRDGRIHDFHGGQKDLQEATLRFVGKATERIHEDYLRILRLFRFWARFQFSPEPSALAAVSALCSGMKHLSQERVTGELLETLSQKNLTSVLSAMIEHGVLSHVLPEVNPWQDRFLEKTPSLETLPESTRPVAILASMLRLAGATANTTALAKRLKFSKEQQNCFCACRDMALWLESVPEDSAEAMERIDDLEKLGGEGFFMQTWHPFAKVHVNEEQGAPLKKLFATENTLGALRKTPMPLDGLIVMQHTGLNPGTQLGQVMRTLLRAFRNQAWRTSEEGLKYLEVSGHHFVKV